MTAPAPSPIPPPWKSALLKLERQLDRPVSTETMVGLIGRWIAVHEAALGEGEAFERVLRLLDHHLEAGRQFEPLLAVDPWPAGTVVALAQWLAVTSASPWNQSVSHLAMVMRHVQHLDDANVQQLLYNYRGAEGVLRAHLAAHGCSRRVALLWLGHPEPGVRELGGRLMHLMPPPARVEAEVAATEAPPRSLPRQR